MSTDLLAGRYRRVRELGRGAMGEVWLAEDLVLGRSVAVKRLRSDAVGRDRYALERMAREARTAARLQHPNIVGVYDLITEDDRPYLIMEYVDGESLADRLRRTGPLPVADAAGIFAQIAAGLEHAHRASVVHRDVKPANILLAGDGRAKIADLGIARSEDDASLTQTGHTIGTVAYMAPEIARGDAATAASDMWSLGASLYAAVEGHSPHGGATEPSAATLLTRLVTESIPAPSRAGAATGLLGRLLGEPQSRPTAGQAARELRVLADNDPDQTRRRASFAVHDSDSAAERASGMVPAETQTVPAGTGLLPGGHPASPLAGLGSGSPRVAGMKPGAGRVLGAHALIWGGAVVLAMLVSQWSFLDRAGLPFLGDGDPFGQRSLHIGFEAGPRVVFVLLLIVPFLAATALLARSIFSWSVAAGAAVLAGVTTFLFWFSASSVLWVVATLPVLMVLAGWFSVRDRGGVVWAALGPVAVAVALFYAPHAPGPWLRFAPGRWGAHGEFVDTFWYLFVPVLVAGLGGLIVALAARRATIESPRVGVAFVAGLAVAAAVLGVVAQTAFVRPFPTSNGADYAGSSTTIDSDDASVAARSVFDQMESSSSADGCNGSSIDSLAVASYTIDDVSPATSGAFDVTAGVTLTDGSSTTVTVRVGSDSSGEACVEPDSVQESGGTPATSIAASQEPTSAPSAMDQEPDDVPSVPSSDDPVPTDATVPGSPADAAIPYTSSTIPATPAQLVEYQPGTGLDSKQTGAIAGVITFMIDVNQQHLADAYDNTIYSVNNAQPESSWAHGYLTSRYYQVAFGEPVELNANLVIVPARWISHQNPQAQGRTDNSTCDYWPQYLFVMNRVGGTWLYTEAYYQGRSDVQQYERLDTTNNELRLNPLQQRVSC